MRFHPIKTPKTTTKKNCQNITMDIQVGNPLNVGFWKILCQVSAMQLGRTIAFLMASYQHLQIGFGGSPKKLAFNLAKKKHNTDNTS